MLKRILIFLLVTSTVFAEEVKREFICADTKLKRVAIFDKEGKITWSYKTGKGKCCDISILKNGNFLMCIRNRKKSEIIELTRDKKIVWKYQGKGELFSCQRLENGNTVIAFCTSGKIIEVNKDKKIVVQFKIQGKTKNAHGRLRRVRKGSDGLSNAQ